MKIKESLLELFESNKGIFLSGENIAKNLGCSRTAVWKAVKALQSDGYSIDAVPNKGYLLSAETDILSSQGIRKYLSPLCRSRLEITVLPSVNSTNAYLQENIGSGIKDGYTVLAHRQTNGKGRIGRSFFSPPDTGVYMSLLLRPENYSAEQAMQITTIASVAACEAIETVSEHTASIKWVNDVYIGKKKVSGILTEASFALENKLLDYAILGIGFNAYPPEEGFPSELDDIVCSVFEKRVADGKNRLAAAFLNCFMKYYTAQNHEDYIEKYRKRSLVLGKSIFVYKRGLPATAKAIEVSGGSDVSMGLPARALDIDNHGGLIVRYEDGSIETLSTGEISIRLQTAHPVV